MYKDFNRDIDRCEVKSEDGKLYYILNIVFDNKLIKTLIESNVIIWMRKTGSFKKECSSFKNFYEFFESVTVSLNYQNNFNIKELTFEYDSEHNLIDHKIKLN